MASILPFENGPQADQALATTFTPFEWQSQLDQFLMNFDFVQALNLPSESGDHEPQAVLALAGSDPAQELPLFSTPFELEQEFDLLPMPGDHEPYADQDLADTDFGQEYNLAPMPGDHEPQADHNLPDFDPAQEVPLFFMPSEFDHELTLPSMAGAHEPQASQVLSDSGLAQGLDLSSMPGDHEYRGEPSPFPNSYSAANASYPNFGTPSLGYSSSHESNSSPELQLQRNQQQQRYGNIQTSNVYECRRRESSEGKAYRECSSANEVANYWNLRHTSVDTPRPEPIRYKSPEERALARLEKKALDEARRTRKLAVREKEREKRGGEKEGGEKENGEQ